MTGRQDEVAAAKGIVSDEVERYRADHGPAAPPPWSRPCGPGSRRSAGPSWIASGSKRSDLDDGQWEEVDAVTRAMVAKLLHQPTVVLKEAAGTPRGERLVEALRALFDL